MPSIGTVHHIRVLRLNELLSKELVSDAEARKLYRMYVLCTCS